MTRGVRRRTVRTGRIAAVTAALLAMTAHTVIAATPKLVALAMYVKLDRVAANPQHGKLGDLDHIRLTYDPAAVDPLTHRVPLVNFQHRLKGKWMPAVPDPVYMPMTDAWLDLEASPPRLHFRAAVLHGEPIVIEVDENTRRLTIHPANDAAAVVLSGAYWIDARGMDARSEGR